MFIGILLGIIFIAAAIGLGFAACSAFDNSRSVGGACSVVGCIIMVIAFLAIPFSIRTVDTGNIAVVKQLGEAKYIRSAGTHFDFWMTKTYTTYDAKVQNVDITTSAYSSDAQTMEIAMTLQYQIISDKVVDIAKEYGTLDILQNRIQSIAIEKTKSVLSSYKAMEIIEERATMSPLVENAIKEAIGEKYFVTVQTVVLTDISFSATFEKAVEDKMVAEQAKLQKEYENQAAEEAAETAKKVAEMRADAEAYAKEKAAEAEAKAIIAKAEAEAEALNIQTLEVAKMLGFTEAIDGKEQIKENLTLEEAKLIKAYIEYIKYIEAWNGELPDTVVGEDASIILPIN
jgi:regulator of protease activity HflC (stomatin/prohibitin superfamily)